MCLLIIDQRFYVAIHKTVNMNLASFHLFPHHPHVPFKYKKSFIAFVLLIYTDLVGRVQEILWQYCLANLSHLSHITGYMIRLLGNKMDPTYVVLISLEEEWDTNEEG